MTKPKSIEAQERAKLKQAAAWQDREGLANLATAAVAVKAAAFFMDIDFTIGLMAQAAALSPAKKKQLAEAGRAIRLNLLPKIAEEGAAVDLIARLPADVANPADLSRRLVSLGLRSNRKRATATFIEFAGPSDEAAVRAVVEPVGGRVTTIASPPTAAAAADPVANESGAVVEPPSTERMMDTPPTDELPTDPAATFPPQDTAYGFLPHHLRPASLVQPLGGMGDHHVHTDVEEAGAGTRVLEAVE